MPLSLLTALISAPPSTRISIIYKSFINSHAIIKGVELLDLSIGLILSLPIPFTKYLNIYLFISIPFSSFSPSAS